MANQTITLTEEQLTALVSRIVSELTITTEPKAPAKAPKGEAPKGEATNTAKAVTVRSKTLDRLVEEAPRFDGMTVEEIAIAVVNGKKRLPKGWVIGPSWTHRVQEGHFLEKDAKGVRTCC